MTSPYLNRPLRTIEQAYSDRAMPEMLEALKHAARSAHHPACDHTFPHRCTCHVAKARAAIAKAQSR